MRALSWLLRVITVVCLAVDAYVHLTLAPDYAGAPGALSQSLLFRIEGGVSIAVALLVLTGLRIAWVLALLVAASAVVVVLITRYLGVGPIGPFGVVSEATWFPQGPGNYLKVASAVAEGVAAVVALIGLGVGTGRRRRAKQEAGAV